MDSGGAVEAAKAARGNGREEEAGMYSVECASCGAVGPTWAIGRMDANGVSPPRRLAVTLCCATPYTKKSYILTYYTKLSLIILNILLRLRKAG